LLGARIDGSQTPKNLGARGLCLAHVAVSGNARGRNEVSPIQDWHFDMHMSVEIENQNE